MSRTVRIAASALCYCAVLLGIVLIVLLPDRLNLYLICAAITVCAMAPFFLSFEGSRPRARELVLIAVLIALAVAGRAAFFMAPNFKPMLAIVILASVCLTPESGFLIGSLSIFLSNMLFGQGPWTPFQMAALGFTGFFAALLFSGRQIRRIPLALYGALSTFFLYSTIVDISSVLMLYGSFSWQSIAAVVAAALPFNLIHTAATVIFMLVLSGPMISQLTRIKIKYGILTPR